MPHAQEPAQPQDGIVRPERARSLGVTLFAGTGALVVARVLGLASGFGQDMEAAVYFSFLEALQNVAKYAVASPTAIVLSNSEGSLRFTVTDDGAGFDSSGTSYGTGLQEIAGRLAALDGAVEIKSEPGHGTTLTGSIPIDIPGTAP